MIDRLIDWVIELVQGAPARARSPLFGVEGESPEPYEGGERRVSRARVAACSAALITLGVVRLTWWTPMPVVLKGLWSVAAVVLLALLAVLMLKAWQERRETGDNPLDPLAPDPETSWTDDPLMVLPEPGGFAGSFPEEPPEPDGPLPASKTSVLTTCPRCALTLIVVREELRAAEGYVSCGRCAHVFYATTREDKHAVHQEEDSLADASFYMAHGLYDEAADLLQIAISQEPQRTDLKVALLEACFGWNNKALFLTTAHELAQSPDKVRPEQWDKIVLMGQQIAPRDALFSADRRAVKSVDMGLESGELVLDYVFAEPDPGELEHAKRPRGSRELAAQPSTAGSRPGQVPPGRSVPDARRPKADRPAVAPRPERAATQPRPAPRPQEPGRGAGSGTVVRGTTTRPRPAPQQAYDPLGLDQDPPSEVGTKLDLARAYMDLGDPHGAHAILEEVLSEGTAEQRREAQQLIQKLPVRWRPGGSAPP